MDQASPIRVRGQVALVAALLALVAALVAPIGAAQAAATATLSGTVTDPTGYPLSGVDVVLKESDPDAGPRQVARVRTDAAGRYKLATVPTDPAGEYFLVVTDRTGHHQESYVSDITVTGNTTRDVRLRTAGFVQGTVSTRVGDGPVVPGRSVRVTALSDDDAHFGAARATPTGHYRLGGLAPGRYRVQLQDLSGKLQGLCYDQVAWDGNETCSQPVTLVTVRAGRTTTLDPQLLDEPEVAP